MGLSTNLQSHWSLEAASGTRVDDVVATANDLSDNNTVTGNPGKVGNACQFTTANSEYLSRADNASLSTGDIDFAFGCWCYFDTVTGGTGKTLVNKFLTTGNQREYVLYYSVTNTTPQNRFSWLVSSNGTATTELLATFGAASIATWYYVGCYHDSVNNLLGIGVNDTWNTVSYSSGIFDGTAQFALGALNNGALFFMDGRIDQVGYWKNYVPSAAEWTWLHNSGTGRTYAEIAAYEASGQPTALRQSLMRTGARRFGRGIS